MRNLIIIFLVMLPFLGGLYSGCATKKSATRSVADTTKVADSGSVASGPILSARYRAAMKAADSLDVKSVESAEGVESVESVDSVASVTPATPITPITPDAPDTLDVSSEDEIIESDGEQEEVIVEEYEEWIEESDTTFKEIPEDVVVEVPFEEELIPEEVLEDEKPLVDSVEVKVDSLSLKATKTAERPTQTTPEVVEEYYEDTSSAEVWVDLSDSEMSDGTSGHGEDDKKIVEFTADIMRPIKVADSTALNLLGNVVLYHNGAVITCDSAVRYSERHMECFNRVIINQNTTYVYGDRADYNGELNEARVYAPIVKIVDEDAIMYTYDFRFNTLDKIGEYRGGATLSQKDNHMESQRGYYYVDNREFIGVEEVEIRNPDYEMMSDSAMYNLNTEEATFFVKSYIWNSKGEILSADKGKYKHITQEYNFTRNAYIITEDQEVWADSMEYNSENENAILRNNIQLRDEEQKIMGFGDYGQYWGGEKKGLLTRNPSMMSFDPEEPDTLYVRADSMFMYTFSRDSVFVTTVSDEAYEKGLPHLLGEELIVPSGGSKDAMLDDAGDSTLNGEGADGEESEFSLSEDVAIADSLASQEVWEQFDGVPSGETQVGEEKQDETADGGGSVDKVKTKAELKAEVREARRVAKAAKREAKRVAKEEARNAKRKAIAEVVEAEDDAVDSLQLKVVDFLKEIELPDSLGIDIDQFIGLDSLELATAIQNVTDSLGVELPILRESIDKFIAKGGGLLDSEIPADSLKSLDLKVDEPLNEEDTIQRVFFGYNNVRIYRTDFQAVCDSIVGFSLDSTLHLYIEPVLWNEQNQISSEIIDLYTDNEKLDKAVFRGEPFMAAEVDDSNRYNQIKGKLMEAYFRDNDIYRYEVKGNGQTYYYMEDDKTHDLMGFLVAECADITFLIEDRQMDKIIYRLDPVYTIYPMDKIPATQEEFLPGFKWEAERRPERGDVFNRVIRPSEREAYEQRDKPLFPLTDAIFKDKERMIKERIWRERNDALSHDAVEFIRSIEREQEQAEY